MPVRNGEVNSSSFLMALRLSKYLGPSPESWLLMQGSYDLWQAKQNVDLSGIVHLAILSKS